MQSSIEYSGLWWLPENPKNKIHGKLSFSPKTGTMLSLDGAFHAMVDGVDFYGIILGDCFGKKITLRNCSLRHLETRWNPDAEAYKKSEFRVSAFYIGCHFAKKEDIKFTQLHVGYSQLEEWLGERPFDYKRSKNEEGLSEHIWKFTMPKAKEIILDKCKITIGYGFSMGFGISLTPKFEAHVGLSIDVGDEMHMDDFFPLAYSIKNFLSLAMGDEVSILTIEGTNKNMKEFGTIQISYREKVSNQKLFDLRFLPFPYKSISERPEFYLQNWFNMIENLKPIYELYFGTAYNPHLYPTHIFLSFAQAIESYHSRKFDNRVIPDDMFDKHLPHILNAVSSIPEEYRQLFISRAKNMNRKSLRTRIKELFETHGNLFKLFVDDKDGFIEKVVVTRNYYTHYSKGLENEAAKLLDLPFLCDKLRFMLIVILLKEIGFDDEFTEQVLRKYMRFTAVRHIYA